MSEFIQTDEFGNIINNIVVNKLEYDSIEDGEKYCEKHFGGKWKYRDKNASKLYFHEVKIDKPCYGLFWGKNIAEYQYPTPSLKKIEANFIKPTTDYFLGTKEECKQKALELNLEFREGNSIYVNLPNNKSLAMIYRNGSSLFLGLIRKTFFDGKGLGEQAIWHRKIIDNETQDPKGTPYAIIRDPIDRFVSAYALGTGSIPDININDFIDWLITQNKSTLNLHFRPQTLLIGDFENIKMYDFAKDLTPLALELGLPTPLPIINSTHPSKKPKLNKDQLAKLQQYYADDVELYKRVSNQ